MGILTFLMKIFWGKNLSSPVAWFGNVKHKKLRLYFFTRNRHLKKTGSLSHKFAQNFPKIKRLNRKLSRSKSCQVVPMAPPYSSPALNVWYPSTNCEGTDKGFCDCVRGRGGLLQVTVYLNNVSFNPKDAGVGQKKPRNLWWLNTQKH